MQYLLLVLLLLLSPAPALAQTCLGGPDLSVPSPQLMFGGSRIEGARGLSVGLGGGSNRFFSSGSASFTRFEGLDESRFTISSVLGSQIAGNRPRTFAFCPIGIIEYGFGPSPPPYTLRTLTIAGGGSVGIVASMTRSFSVVPTFGVAFVRELDTVTINGVGQSLGINYGLAAIGIGFRFNRHQSAVTPSLSIPFGIAVSDVTYGVSLTTNF